MNTSYFAKYKGNKGVSIARGTPDWFQGRQYLPLCPPWDLINKYKQDNDSLSYIQEYNRRVLDQLDPQQVYNDLGEGAVLLCWERTGEFCHRYLVANWMKHHIGIEVTEL